MRIFKVRLCLVQLSQSQFSAVSPLFSTMTSWNFSLSQLAPISAPLAPPSLPRRPSPLRGMVGLTVRRPHHNVRPQTGLHFNRASGFLPSPEVGFRSLCRSELQGSNITQDLTQTLRNVHASAPEVLCGSNRIQHLLSGFLRRRPQCLRGRQVEGPTPAGTWLRNISRGFGES